MPTPDVAWTVIDCEEDGDDVARVGDGTELWVAASTAEVPADIVGTGRA